MNRKKSNKNNSLLLAIGSLALILGLAALPVSAQQDQNLPGYPVATGPASPWAPQDTAPQNTQSTPPSYPTVPPSLTLPAGTVIQVRTNEWLSSDHNLPGDGFNATLAQPIVVDGWVVARRGQNVFGRVTIAQKARHDNHNASQLGLQLSELTFVDGQLLPIQTQLVQTSAGTDHGRDVGIVGTTTGVGAVIGAIAAGGTGAAVGAGIGAIAGLGVISTNGKPTVLPPETPLTFQLEGPVTLSTTKSQFAFQTVTQEDYSNASNQPRYLRYGAYPPPPYYGYPYYGYPYAYGPYFYPYAWGFYPAPLYFGFGFGPRYYGFGRFGRRFR